MTILTWILTGVLVLSSFILVLFILLHKGKGGGMSDMFGGGMSANLGASGVAEGNLNRFLSLIHISEPTRLHKVSRMPSSA